MATLPDATQQPHDSASSLTVDMVIDWMLEQASYTGDLGYSSHFLKPDSLLKHAVVEPDRFSSTEPCVDRDFFGPDPVIKAMKRFSAEIEHLKARMNIMMSSQNRPVLIETEKEIHRRLLVAGKTDEDIKRCTLKKTPLRSKIVDWYILLNPINGREETVEVKIYLGERGRKKPVKINLPIHASMEKVYSLLSTHLTVELEALDPEGTKEIRHYDASKPWRYQLVTADQTTTVRKASIPLLSDADYRKMIYHITRRDIRPPTAHLSQVSVDRKLCLARLTPGCRKIHPGSPRPVRVLTVSQPITKKIREIWMNGKYQVQMEDRCLSL